MHNQHHLRAQTRENFSIGKLLRTAFAFAALAFPIAFSATAEAQQGCGIEYVNDTTGIVYYTTNVSASWSYVCLNGCYSGSKVNGRVQRQFSGLALGTSYNTSFQIQDNVTGQILPACTVTFTKSNTSTAASSVAASSTPKSSVAPSSVPKSSLASSSVPKSSVVPSSVPKSSVAPSSAPKSSIAPSSSSMASAVSSAAGTSSSSPTSGSGDFGIDASQMLYHTDGGQSGNWAYLCLDDNCLTVTKTGNRYHRQVSVAIGSTHTIQFKVQDNATGQCLSDVKTVTYVAGGVATSTTCSIPDVTPPSIPTGLAAVSKNGNAATLTWIAATDNKSVSKYDVYRNGTLVGSSASLSYMDVGLTGETTYSYTVRACDAAGNCSAKSAAKSYTTPSGVDTTPPTVPTGLASTNLTDTGANSNSLTINWTAATDEFGVVKYDVYRGGVLQGSSTSTSFINNGLTVNTPYSFTVRACDAATNCSAQSAPYSLTTRAPDTFQYGRHYPHGLAATNYIYGPDGMWKHMLPLEYRWNYYNYSDNPSNHPHDFNQLLAYANGTHFTTSRDANKHLLWDFDHDGEIDTNDGGFAFHEHNGKGVSGASQDPPFTHFWFDDNMLARFLSQAYGRPLPNGLSVYNDFTRWQIMGGDTSNWTPYNQGAPDQLALDGLYFMKTGSLSTAINKWETILANSGYSFNSADRRFVYPNMHENYHLGLFEVLTAHLMNSSSITAAQYANFLQHWVSIRSNLLSRQERSASGAFLGWRSSIGVNTTLINTESVAIGVLGLGAGATATYEVGQSPMQHQAKNYLYRPSFVLSAALEGQSSAGYMAYGPNQQYPTGNFTADFILRAASPVGKVATVDVFDATTQQVLAVKDVFASDLSGGDIWKKVELSFPVTHSGNSIEFRIWWYGNSNMDAAAIRVH